VLTSVAGGISAVQGSFGLLGAEGEQVQKALLKVQSALALSQGLSTIKDSAKDFQRLNAIIQSTAIFQKANNAATAIAITLQKAFGVATVGTGRAFTILKGAIAATGIGLLVVGLTTLIGKISEWTSTSEKAAEAQKKLAEQTEVINGALQNQIDVLTAVGNKEKEILGLKKQQIDNELNVLRTAAKAKGELTLDELKKFRDLKTQKEVLDIEEQNRLKKIDDDAKKKQDEKNKEQSEKNKALNQEIKNANKQTEDEIRKLRQEAELNAITDQNARAKRQAEITFENRKLEIEELKANEKLKTQLLVEEQKIRDKAIADAKAAAQQAEFDAIFARLEREQELEEIEKKRIADANQKEFDDLFAQLDAETKAEAAAAEAQKEIEKQKADFRKQQFSEVGDALGKLGEIVGQQTAAGKALGIAQALINTYSGATEALRQKSVLPSPFDFVAKAINVAAIIASGIKSVKAIAAVKVPGGGGGTPSIPSVSVGGGAAPISPSAPVQNTLTQLDQSSINRLGSATNRSYVLESDVTNSQERITRINRAARLN
jgi:chemotaxis protein histidine kinase CheA